MGYFPVMANGTTSPSVVEHSTSPTLQKSGGQASEVISRSPKRSRFESEGDNTDPVEVKKQKGNGTIEIVSSTVKLPIRVKPRLTLQNPVSNSGPTPVEVVVAQPATCKRKRQDTVSPDGLANLTKKLRFDSPPPAAAKPKKAKSSWDSFDVKAFDNKSGKPGSSWNFKQFSYANLQPPDPELWNDCPGCAFRRWIDSYSLGVKPFTQASIARSEDY